MKAVIWTKYGTADVLKVQQINKPVIKETEVLIKIHAATVTMGDCEMRSLQFPFYLALPMRLYIGFSKPKRIRTPGMELAGTIEAVGEKVTRFAKGDAIFGSPGMGLGAYAEYKVLPAHSEDTVLVKKPDNIPFEEAAAATIGGLESLHFLGLTNIKKGQKVLIVGAGGSIGTFGVQLAKLKGAQVTAVDRGDKLDMLRSIGADKVIDYTREDYFNGGQTYEVIFDVVGKTPFFKTLKITSKKGYYIIANPRLRHYGIMLLRKLVSRKRIIVGTTIYRNEDLQYIAHLLEAGQIKTVIDKTYSLDKISDAHRYVEGGNKKGNVVINVI